MNHLPTGLATLGLLIGALLLMPALAATGDGATTAPVLFGMDSASMAAQANAGVKADYGTFWIGPWTLSSGWGGPDAQLASMKAAGVTPAIHFYYWGDDITPSCVENGCWSSLHNAQKTRAGWEALGAQLTSHLASKMGGSPAVVFLESEFNKGGISTYEPFDGYMADMAAKLHAGYPQAVVVLGFGNWDSGNWGNFDRAAAASDMVGVQGMRGSTRQAKIDMYTLYDGLLAGVKTLEAKFPGKPIMLTDLAVSSYPESEYLQVQSDVLAEIFTNLGVLKSHGVQALIYRSWTDSANMDLANYYGMAERYWGLASSGGAYKPSAQVWIDGVKAERAGSTPTPPPTPTPIPAPTPIAVGTGVTTQAEAFATKQAGGQQADPAAQGGTMWNLWSNGAVSQSYNFTGAYDLTVRARGTLASGVAPHMDVYVAGAKVLAADPQAAYADHRVSVTGIGVSEVRIVFTNDLRTSTEDRNLVLDTVALAPANAAPTAAFQAAMQNLTATLDGSASSDPDGNPLTYAWAFGDGATAAGPQATHAYAAAGSYTVVLTVSDGRLSGSAAKVVTAVQPNRAPVASFAATVKDFTVSLDASASSDPDGNTLAYAWAFGDGASGSGRRANHTYAAAGTYTAKLTASDGTTSGTATRSVTVAAPPPFTAAFAVVAGSNEWWQEVRVTSSAQPAKVELSANGGPWQPLALRSWGNWATSVHIAKGTPVAFRATDSGGHAATSAQQPWLGAPAFAATFSPKAVGNNWWVEVAVTSGSAIAKVEASLNGGAWTQLPKDAWGTYAKSLPAPNGTKVVFRATDASGATATSAATTWT